MRILSILSLLLLGLAGCSPVKVVSTDASEDADFASYQSFQFYEVQTDEPVLLMQQQQALEKLKEAIAVELTERGMEEASDASQADLLVNIGVTREEKVQTREADIRTDMFYMGQRNYRWEAQEIPVNTYIEGTVVVEVVDPVKGAMVWQGVVSGILSKKPEKNQALIPEAMDKLFREYPVQP